MVIFNSYVKLPEGIDVVDVPKSAFKHIPLTTYSCKNTFLSRGDWVTILFLTKDLNFRWQPTPHSPSYSWPFGPLDIPNHLGIQNLDPQKNQWRRWRKLGSKLPVKKRCRRPKTFAWNRLKSIEYGNGSKPENDELQDPHMSELWQPSRCVLTSLNHIQL